MLRMTLNFPDEAGTLKKLKEPINFIIGNNTYIPPDLKPERTCLLGECLWHNWLGLEEEGSLTPQQLKDGGALVIPGCPSHGRYRWPRGASWLVRNRIGEMAYFKYGLVLRVLVGQASRLSFRTGKMPVPRVVTWDPINDDSTAL